MTILILTSRLHIYSNAVLSSLIRRHIFKGHRVIVYEQDAVVPGLSKIGGLKKYVHVSGIFYVVQQMGKQCLFVLRQAQDVIGNRRKSFYYPYNRLADVSWIIEERNELTSDSIYRHIQSLKPDLILSVYSKLIIPKRILTFPRFGAVNLHPGLLPQYRGVSPVFWAMSRGDTYAGVTLHYLDKGIDTGAIISQKRISTRGYSTEHSLYLKLTCVGTDLVYSYLSSLFSFCSIAPSKKIKRSRGSYYSLPTKDAVKMFRQKGNRFFVLSEFSITKETQRFCS